MNDTTTPDVVVLSTLHGFHAEVPSYGFQELARIVEALSPAVLSVELTPSDLENRVGTTGKPEYHQAIFPLLAVRRYDVVPMEPGEPLHSELIRELHEEGHRLQTDQAQSVAAFGRFANSIFQYLCRTWRSPSDVNSEATDALFEAKHVYQDDLFPGLAVSWERWNEHFVGQIACAALRHPGQRTVVLAGAEHGYFLRGRLAQDPRLRLRRTPELLDALVLAGGTEHA